MGADENQVLTKSVGMAIGAATGAYLGRGTGAFMGAALGQGFASLIDDPSVAALIEGKGKSVTNAIAHALDVVLGERRWRYGQQRAPVMGGRTISRCLEAAALVFDADKADPDKAILDYWIEGLTAATRTPGAHLNVWVSAREWEEAGDRWPQLLAARLWSPARMEGLLVNETIAFLAQLPENPDSCGLSWEDLKRRKDKTAAARDVPADRRRLLLNRRRDRLADAMKRSFAAVVVADEPARDELATYAVLFSIAALGGEFFGAEAAVTDFRAMLADLNQSELVESLAGK